MREINKHLLDIESFLAKNNVPIFNKLQDGIKNEIVLEKLNAVGIKSKDLAELYSWRNGIKDFGEDRISDLELFPEGVMPSLENAVVYYNIYTKEQRIWEQGLFPIFTNGGGDFYLIKTEKEADNPIYLYSPSILLSEEPELVYYSLDSLVDSVLSCFLKGAYKYNDVEGCFDVDYDLRQEICKMKNPNIAYWES